MPARRRCLDCLSLSLPARLHACLALGRGSRLRKLSHRPASSLVLTSCKARGTSEPIHMQRHPPTGKVTWDGGSESRSISAHGPDEALRRVCRHPRACRYPLGRSRQVASNHRRLSAPRRICALGHCHRRLYCAWGFLSPCAITAFDIMLRPPDSESECAPGPHLPVSVGSTPGALLSPLSPHPCPCPGPCPCPHPHRLTHILPPLLGCVCVGVGVGDGLLVDSPCPPASPLPCCPAALQPAPHHAAWSGTGQPILSVPGPPPGRKTGSRTEPALHSKLATPSHHSPSARLCVKRL